MALPENNASEHLAKFQQGLPTATPNRLSSKKRKFEFKAPGRRNSLNVTNGPPGGVTLHKAIAEDVARQSWPPSSQSVAISNVCKQRTMPAIRTRPAVKKVKTNCSQHSMTAYFQRQLLGGSTAATSSHPVGSTSDKKIACVIPMRPLEDNVQQKSSTTADHRQIRTPSKSPVTNIFDIDMGGIDDDDDFDFTSTLQYLQPHSQKTHPKFGLKINIKKTEVLYQHNSTRTRGGFMVDGNKLNSVPEFTHLGSTISSDGRIDAEIQRRMAKASASFGRLRQRLWNNHHVSRGSKARSTVNCAIHLTIRSRGLDSVQTTGEKAACLHDATSAFDHEANLEGQSD
ncbi:hypothetical protein LSAT2_012150 [Lamellibrachia satsuma]|nr:hypothetical protein LSAT2_012150 [Lamellibrachia satsuma]